MCIRDRKEYLCLFIRRFYKLLWHIDMYTWVLNYFDHYFWITNLKIIISIICLLYTSPSPRDQRGSRMPSSAWKKKRRTNINKRNFSICCLLNWLLAFQNRVNTSYIGICYMKSQVSKFWSNYYRNYDFQVFNSKIMIKII